MTHKARIRTAGLVTTAFLGGLAALGLSIGNQKVTPKNRVLPPLVKTEVIRETRTQTIEQPKRSSNSSNEGSGSSPNVQLAQAQPVSNQPIQTPKEVRSRTSPVSSGEEGESDTEELDGESGEHEAYGEHEEEGEGDGDD